MKKIYLAGFDVFAPDAVQRGARMKLQCAAQGLIGLYPLDNEAPDVGAIFTGNCALIDEADAVIANLNPFRGAEPDSGTCFEVGYAYAKGKPVFAYLTDGRTMQEKHGAADADGFAVENFGMPMNLMLSSAAEVVIGEFADALRHAVAELCD